MSCEKRICVCPPSPPTSGLIHGYAKSVPFIQQNGHICLRDKTHTHTRRERKAHIILLVNKTRHRNKVSFPFSKFFDQQRILKIYSLREWETFNFIQLIDVCKLWLSLTDLYATKNCIFYVFYYCWSYLNWRTYTWCHQRMVVNLRKADHWTAWKARYYLSVHGSTFFWLLSNTRLFKC